MKSLSWHILVGLGGLLCAWGLVRADPAPDLAAYRGVDKAVTKVVAPARGGKGGQTGYLGVVVRRDERGRLVVEEVQPDSPAILAGVNKDDVVLSVAGQEVKTPEAFREWLQARGPGEAVRLSLSRGDKPVEVSATLASTSRPMTLAPRRVYLGLDLGDAKEGEGVRVDVVAPDSPAATAGFKVGDRIAKVDGAEFKAASRLADVLAEKRPGDVLAFAVRRDGKEVVLKATLGGERGGRGGFDGGGGPAAPWKKDVFRLAVVGIEFPDVKHNAKVPTKGWEEALFSKGTYRGKSGATGQPVYGSLNDYFLEQSCGAFHLEGKVFDWVEVGKKRGDYQQGSGTSNKTGLPLEALEKVATRDGKDAFKDFDGFLFLYAGDRIPTNRGALYYPHSGTIGFQSRRLPYLLNAEGGSRETPVGAFVKELGEVLGLPDLAARPENQGSVGIGAWCAMSNPFTDGRPQHLCAWSKEKLGWLKPAAIDPAVKQKLVLAPVEDSPKECFKVLARPDGSEYFLLENRRKTGFDANLPGEGLLVWRVVQDRPSLVASHGVEGPLAPTLHLGSVPYPSAANNALTPETTPSSRSPQGGGLPVHITEIRRLPDGRVTFHIGYEYH
ncbi:MAG TPA: PDZ domain-containing protein [Gemmataceae bacterium]|nr:PDZ domain-containing protein [Gemmataceae bacterium]